jgi:glyoxylase I family protein
MLALHHLAVVVSDLARAERFYVGVLGLPVVRRWSDDRGMPRSLWVELEGDAFLAIERAGADAPKRSDEAPGLHCVAFRIAREERQRQKAMLEQAGFPVERESPYTLYVRDPDGNLVAFSHHPDPT